MSNLSGCRVCVLAAGGSSDAVALEDVLSVFQHCLIAELQVELEITHSRGLESKALNN